SEDIHYSAIAIDTNNTVWAGFRNLHKYDGISWTEIQIEDSISDGQIEEIVVDKTNNLWLKFNAAIYYVIMSNSYNVEEYSNSDFTPIIYPNPAIDDVTIDFPGEKATILIYDLNGREIKSVEGHNSKANFNTSELKNGTYIIRVNNGQDYKNIKLIITH
ncbi:MAG TPA: T9SS type A sorting domain-containing protein, partial [Bacteroidales bacterium]|nr:T9SS type A sorting domain-containing protein [Bacteroidales bacterium]